MDEDEEVPEAAILMTGAEEPTVVDYLRRLVRLRQAELADAEFLSGLRSDPVVAVMMQSPFDPIVDYQRFRYSLDAGVVASANQLTFIVEAARSGSPIGVARLSAINARQKTATGSLYMHRSRRRLAGYGLAAAILLFDKALIDLGLRKLYWTVAGYNQDLLKIMETFLAKSALAGC